jgi:hypothetical protein|eukprot:SAG25_NODE_66_length_17563_cov_34.737918_12_plen_75_part_00
MALQLALSAASIVLDFVEPLVPIDADEPSTSAVDGAPSIQVAGKVYSDDACPHLGGVTTQCTHLRGAETAAVTP